MCRETERRRIRRGETVHVMFFFFFFLLCKVIEVHAFHGCGGLEIRSIRLTGEARDGRLRILYQGTAHSPSLAS